MILIILSATSSASFPSTRVTFTGESFKMLAKNDRSSFLMGLWLDSVDGCSNTICLPFDKGIELEGSLASELSTKENTSDLLFKKSNEMYAFF